MQMQPHASPTSDNCSVQLCCSLEKKKDRELTQEIHSFHVSIQQGKSSLGNVLLMATKPRLDRKVLVSTGFQKLYFHSYHPPPNPAAAFVAAFVRILLQMKTDE